MKTIIILVPVTMGDRTVLEHIENEKFENANDIPKVLNLELGKSVFLQDLTNFMDYCNNQELDLESYWVGYVQVPKATIV